MIQIARVFVCLMLCMCAAFWAKAQNRGELKVYKDSLITVMQEYRSGKRSFTKAPAPSEDRNPATRTTARGFRVQVFLGSNRNEAYAEQARFKRLYPDIDTYITYEEPNYRVKVGDFRSRAEAQRLMEGLKHQFSNVFLFTETIFIYH